VCGTWRGAAKALALAGFLALAVVPARPETAETQGTSTLDTLPFSKKLKLAKAGDEEAQMAVARHYDTGEGARKSPLQGAHWYRLAAQRGNPEAQFRLARIVHVGARDIEKNMPLAAQLYEAAAKQGNHEAEYWTGYCYEQGEGVEKDLKKAVEWYQKAAEAGEPRASNNLGLIYLNSKEMPRDLARAFQLFKAAAEKGDQWAENNLAGMYEMGWGVTADKAEAIRLYRQAAAHGNPHAITNLKRLGVAVDDVTVSGSEKQSDQQQN